MKQKVFSVALVVLLVTLVMSNASLAYFTDTSEKQNVFTMGKVDIEITEKFNGDVDNDGNPDDGVKPGTPIHSDPTDNNSTVTGYSYDDVLPGSVLHKEPVISVAADSSDCWLAAQVTFNSAYGSTAATIFGATGLLRGGVSDGLAAAATTGYDLESTNVLVSIATDATAGTTTVTYYFKNVHAKNSSETLFKTVNIPTTLTTLQGTAVNVDVKSAAIQAEGFADIAAAKAQLTSLLNPTP